MHQPAANEKQDLSVLLSSSKLSTRWQESSVGVEQRKSFCGWKLIRPAAAYVVTQTPSVTRRKKILLPDADSHPSRHVKFDSTSTGRSSKLADYPYMSNMTGHLNEDYSYVYREGLSSDVSGNSVYPFYKHFPTQTRSTIELEPVVQYRCPDPSTQIDISRIVSMQLKPEVLVEQLLIENRLRTMSMAALPTLNLEGVGVSSDKSSQKSDSAPLLRKSSYQNVKKKRRKPYAQLEWCSLNAGSDNSPQLGRLREDQLKHIQTQQPTEDFPFNNFSYSHQSSLNFRHSLNPSVDTKAEHYSQTKGTGKLPERKSSAQQSVHVVEPILDRTLPVHTDRQKYQRDLFETKSPNTLTSLLKLWKNTPVRY
ncbi:uncharacterized protein LOC135341203 isoform X2 [Halichondria panicea]